jgi:ABC-type glycerol-3-phosphate transport system substrate-binding protein
MKDNDTQPEQFSTTSETQAGVGDQGGSSYRTEEIPTQPSVENTMQNQSEATPAVTQPEGSTPQSVLADQGPTQGANASQIEEMSLPRKKGGFSKRLGVIGIVVIMVVLILGGVVYKLQSGNIGKLFGNKGEIVWWGIIEEESVVRPLIEQFEEENPDIKVTYNRQSEKDYRVRLTNSLAGGKGPDIFEFHNSWVPMYFSELSTLPGNVMSQSEYSQTFYSIIVSDLLTKDGLVGIPLFYDAITLYINEDIFASVAKQPPTTWNELGDLVDPGTGVLTLTDDRGAIIQSGVAIGKTKNVDFWQDILGTMMSQNGADLKQPIDSQSDDAVSYYREIGKDVWDESLPQSTAAFAQGVVAMYFGPTRKAYDIASMNSNLKFKTAPMVQLPKNTPTDPDIAYATYWVQGVWNKSTNEEDAWKFLRFLSERSSLEKLNSERKTVKNFELASPRMDMARMYLQDPILSAVVAQAENARSWYLADETFDGETGINSKVAELYEEVVLSKDKPKNTLEEMAPSLAHLLSKYGIVKVTPTPEKKESPY